MRNRAKCKLCHTIIESFLPDEIVYCKCGEIAVCDGAAMRMWPIGSPHFLRVDEIGNEIVVSYKEKRAEGESHEESDKPNEPRTKADLIKEVEYMVKNILDRPLHHVTSLDLADFMLRIIDILNREE